MTINLITPETHAILTEIYHQFPVLTLQNKGYEGIDRSKFSEIEKQKDAQVNCILKNAIIGFSRFQNFKVRENGRIVIRFQYDYTADGSDGIPFIGAGYILLDELLNGFETNPKN